MGDEADSVTITSPMVGTVAYVAAAPGTEVRAGDVLLYLEAMKMEHAIHAPDDGTVVELHAGLGEAVETGGALLSLALASPSAPATDESDRPVGPGEATPDEPDRRTGAPAEARTDGGQRADLAEVRARRDLLDDAARPEAVAKRHGRGHRTVRENVTNLLDAGSFSEYGGLAVAAQRMRKGLENLLETTPADGLVTGTGTVNADLFGSERSQVAVAAYDYTVLAGTQGHTNHLKKDRIFELAHRLRLPTIVFAEGGGGRPGDTDVVKASHLDVPAFRLFARLSGHVPLVSIVNGRCFAGNAALAGCADVIIATEGSSLGMAGPAMIEGAGLGRVEPDDVGPMTVQVANGVVDVLVADEAEAVAVAKRYLGYFQGRTPDPVHADQAALRDAVPENRKRTYDVHALIDTLADTGSVLELRRGWAPGMVTALARIDGRPLGVLANDPRHLGGAIDADGADAAARFLQLCDAHGLPVLVLCDTPGFMVGPDAERDAGVRHFSRMFVVGANLGVPIVCVVTRKAYGLGAQAMMGGDLRAPVLTVGWPTAELGPMGLEGAVRLGFRRELEAIEDPDERAEREAQMVELAYAGAKALNVATYGEIDDVIDPADTRGRVSAALDAAGPTAHGGRPFVDTW